MIIKKNIENPFLKQAVEEVQNNIVKKYKTATKTDQKAILQAYDPDTGEILGHTQFIRQIEVDEQQFAKLYLSNFSVFFDLQPASIKVFGYILNNLLPNKDFFYFNREDCMEYTGYKKEKIGQLYRSKSNKFIRNRIINCFVFMLKKPHEPIGEVIK